MSQFRQPAMTDPQRICALIAKVESGQVSHKENGEYLVLCCGWTRETSPRWPRDWMVAPLRMGHKKEKYLVGSACEGPDPLNNAQDALDSLPEGIETCDAFSMTDIMSKVSGVSKWHWELSSGETGRAKTSAAAICLANCYRILAELEGE